MITVKALRVLSVLTLVLYLGAIAFEPTRAQSIRAYYLVLPVCFALWFYSTVPRNGSIPETHHADQADSIRRRRAILILALFLLLETTSWTVLVWEGRRNVEFFVLQGAAILLVSYQVFAVFDVKHPKYGLVLFQLGFLIAVIALSKSMTYAYYYGNTDSIAHSGFSTSIVETSHVSGAMKGYEFFPLFHVLSASTYELAAGSSMNNMMHLVLVLPAFTFPLIFFRIGQSLLFSKNHSLVISYCCSFGSLLILLITEAMPQTLVFSYAVMLILCVLRMASVKRFVMIGFLLSLCIIFTHQVTVPFVMLFVASMHLLRKKETYASGQSAAFWLFLLQITAFVAYSVLAAIWFYHAVALKPIPLSEASVRATELPTGVYMLWNGLRNIGTSLLLFFWIGGTLLILSQRGLPKHLSKRMMVTFSIVSAALYFPSPLVLSPLVTDFLSIRRFSVYLEILVLMVSALGILKAMITLGGRHRVALMPVLTAVIVFSSIASVFNANDTNLSSGYLGPQPKVYFNDVEMKVLESMEKQSGPSAEFADYPSALYLGSRGLDIQSLVVQVNRSIELPGGANVLLRGDFFNQGLIFADASISKSQGGVSSFATDESLLIEPSMNLICDYGSLRIVFASDSTWLSQRN